MRAANTPRPADWVEPEDPHAHSRLVASFLADNGANFFADTSEYQPAYNSSYPYPVASFRFFSGYRVDNHATQNWGYHRSAIASGRTKLVRAYAVFVPGQRAAFQAALKAVFGQAVPSNRIVVVIDMESGPDFAGPGDHSVEANQWAADAAAWTGDWRRVDPYGNVPDLASCWPRMDPRLQKHHVARYDDNPPSNFYAWQYYGALPFPSPPGAPRSCPPFGGYVDMNVIYSSISDIEADYGITAAEADMTPEESGWLANIYTAVNHPSGSANVFTDILAAIGKVPTAPQIAAAVVAALPPSSGGSGPSLLQITAAFQGVINQTHLTTGA